MKTDIIHISLQRYPGRTLLWSLAVACCLTNTAVILMLLNVSSIELGYQSVDGLGAAGIRITDITSLLLEWGLIAWAFTFALMLYRVMRQRLVTPKSARRLGITLMLVTLLLPPLSHSLYATYHISRGNTVELGFQQPLFPLFHYDTTSEVTQDLTADINAPNFLCQSVRRWKLLGIQLRREFYPTLDNTHNTGDLLAKNCTRLR